MTIIPKSRSLFALLFIPLFASYSPESPSDKEKVVLDLIVQGVEQSHFRPVPVDDEFSGKVFDLYLKRIDYSKRFFLKSDIDKLKRYKDQIDDQIHELDFTFFDLSLELINERTEDVKIYCEEILARPFDFEKDESIETDPEKIDFAITRQEIKNRWQQYLKYQTLTRLSTAIEVQEKAKEKQDTTVEIKTLDELKQEAREGVQKNMQDWFSRLDKLDREDRIAFYFNAITNVFDPHTAYFPPHDKENFDISMSGQLEGIGATLQEKDGYIKVTRIVPGSPSWRQGELKAGDFILKVGQGEDEPVDITNMPLDEAVQLIRGKKGTEVRLTVKKLDGEIVLIPIIRDVVILEETYAKSAILKDERFDAKVGYIRLPKFYSDFNHTGARTSADDMKKELKKLKAENVKGIIIDLRDNGGGSLTDVVDMAGYFIEKGPIVQVKSNQGPPYILADRDPAIDYDGPLVVMVNEFSASASEILAAALQDYKRAIIVGSVTHGKGTVQRFYDLDGFVTSGLENIKPLGSIKLTMQKFYRINGDATQLKGVTPDIILPDTYTYIEVGEGETDYPMEWTQINNVNYVPWNWSEQYPPLATIVKKSEARTAGDPVFKLIDEDARHLKEQTDKTTYTLHLEKHLAEQKQLEARSKKDEVLDKPIENWSFSALPSELALAQTDTSMQSRIKAFHEELLKDYQLHETAAVLNDLMSGVKSASYLEGR